jgi:hypothetical protein
MPKAMEGGMSVDILINIGYPDVNSGFFPSTSKREILVDTSFVDGDGKDDLATYQPEADAAVHSTPIRFFQGTFDPSLPSSADDDYFVFQTSEPTTAIATIYNITSNEPLIAPRMGSTAPAALLVGFAMRPPIQARRRRVEVAMESSSMTTIPGALRAAYTFGAA